MPQPWRLLPKADPSPDLRSAVGGHPLVAQLLAQRGFDTPERALPFLHIDHYTPASPSALVGLDRAAHLLHDAIRQGQKILVWGDFDVDGQTSTSLLVAALRDLGADEQVRFHVPNRFTESHGIRVEKLREYLSDPTFVPALLLTCDTGIAETAGVGLARDHGLAVVVTDHHDLPAEFADCELGVDPPCAQPAAVVGEESVRRADAIVNPKFLKPDDPLRTLPGVGVAYKLVQRLYDLAGRAGEEEKFLDLVALGIVADVAEQVNDARYLLQLGLDKLRRTERIGLKALMHNARINPEILGAEDIGYQLGPRMNALGRLEDATVSVELLTTRDAIRAGELAARMERLNNQRRLLTSQITSTAFEILERNPHYLDFNAIVLAHPQWHAGIVGIVASRIVEEFNKPTVLMLNPPGEAARGSARSTPGVDIGASIAACADLLIGHGGHPGAAGLSLPAENVDRFRRELSRQIENHRIDAGPDGLRIDAEVPFGDLSLPLMEQIARLAPYGNGNPKPVFMSRRLTVAEDRRIGKDGTHRKLLLMDEKGSKQPVIWFRGADVVLPEGAIDFAYSLGINEYRGMRSLQLGYVASRPAEQESIDVVIPTHAQREIHDLRQELVQASDPSGVLRHLPTPAEAFWLAEGPSLGSLQEHFPRDFRDFYRTRAGHAPKGRPLVIWSIPPSQETLTWLVETLSPAAIYLVGEQTNNDSLDSVLKSMAGAAKYALGRDCLLPMDQLAARLNTTEAVIRHSLRWLEARHLVRLEEWESGDVVRISSGDGATRDAMEDQILRAELEEQLAEVRAYRRFFKRAKLAELGIKEE
jgi:single-stranded-DNA-specific exonuclease